MTYSTFERYEAAYLLSQGQKLIGTSADGHRKLVSFTFDNSTHEIEDHLLVFQNDTRIQSFLRGFEQVNKLIRGEQDRSGTEQRREHG